jgi:hypothetical protein
MRKLVLLSLFACLSLSSSARAADGGSQSGLLDLAETTEDLAPGGEIDEDAGSGFEKADGGSVGGSAPASSVAAPKMPIVHGCEYAGDVPLAGAAPILLCAAALLLSRRKRVV